LLERVVRASSDEGQVVLDPFCGSGTALAVAERLQRRWIGIDVAPLAIELARARMAHARFELAPPPRAESRPGLAKPERPKGSFAVAGPGLRWAAPRR
jgi:site-specific DNA-methyltransferase (adenine-specific)